MRTKRILFIILSVIGMECFPIRNVEAQVLQLPVVQYADDTNYYWGGINDCRYGKIVPVGHDIGTRDWRNLDVIRTYTYSFELDSVIPVYGLAIAMGKRDPTLTHEDRDLLGEGFGRKWMEEQHYECRLSLHFKNARGNYTLIDSVYLREDAVPTKWFQAPNTIDTTILGKRPLPFFEGYFRHMHLLEPGVTYYSGMREIADSHFPIEAIRDADDKLYPYLSISTLSIGPTGVQEVGIREDDSTQRHIKAEAWCFIYVYPILTPPPVDSVLPECPAPTASVLWQSRDSLLLGWEASENTHMQLCLVPANTLPMDTLAMDLPMDSLHRVLLTGIDTGCYHAYLRRECLHWCYHHPEDTLYYGEWGSPRRICVTAWEDSTQTPLAVDMATPTTHALRLLPNPAQGQVKILATLPMEHLSVYDLQGQLMYHATPRATEYTLSLTGYPRGTYLVAAQTQEGLVCKTLIVQ